MLALIRAFGLTFFVAGFFKLAQDLLTFVSPQVLGYVLVCFEQVCASLGKYCIGIVHITTA